MILDLFKKKDSSLDSTAREVLEQAIAQRAKMDLVFEQAVTSIKGLSCALNTIGRDSLFLDIYGINKPGNFSEKYFNCYFRIREGKAGVGFYGFRSKVETVRQASNGGIVFVASLPARVDRSQRRRSMRVRPELAWFDEIQFWNGAKLGETETDKILLGLGELKQGKLCRLENISAGGVGLHLDREFCRQSEFCPAINDEFTLYIRFAQDIRNQPRELWLTGKAVRVLEDHISKDLDIGVEFRAVGRISPTTGTMEWITIQDNVADELITRVFEWHAALCRDRGVKDL